MIGNISAILVTLAGLSFTVLYFRRNLVRIREKNKSIESSWKRVLNYPFTIIWYGYLFVFFLGLTVNNLIFG